MPRTKNIEICALNIAANPHPAGIYTALLARAAERYTRARGTDFAKITKPIADTENGILSGRILVWTDIDLHGRWLDLSKEDTLTREEQKKISIPENAKPNYRVFSYIFHLSKHRLYYESKNEFSESLGPTVCRRIFENLLTAKGVLPAKTEVEVTVIPQTSAVGRILQMPGLRSIELRLLLPNTDDVDPEKRKRVFDRLSNMNAKRLEEKFVKRAGADRLKPDEDLKDLAAIAAENGYVRGEGRVQSKVSALSTTDVPRRERIDFESGHNLVTRILATIGFF